MSAVITTSRADFTAQVFNYVAIAMGITAIGSYFGPKLIPLEFLMSGGIWLIFIAELALIFTSNWWSKWDAPLNFLMGAAFAFLSGITLYPLLMVAMSVGGIELITQALVATVALSFAAGIYAKTTERDLSGMGGFLMMALIGLIVVGILQMFWYNSMVELVSSGIGVILFSAFIAYDIQMIEKYPTDRPIQAALGLYLSIYNLFVSLLRFLIALRSD